MVSDTLFPAILVDAGNTRIKWGLHDGRALVRTGAIATGEVAKLAAQWRAAEGARRMVASNVAGATVEVQLAKTCEQAKMPLQVIRSGAECLGVVNGYRDPPQLGTDRWAALIAAHHERPGHQLVVNAGTALTIDALAAGGRFLGGVIVPGPALMRRSLDRGTAGLRLTEGAFVSFPESTPDAITSGSIQACAGAIGRMRDAMADEGMAPKRLVLSGGAAAELAPYLPMTATLREHLVLEGLALIAGAGS